MATNIPGLPATPPALADVDAALDALDLFIGLTAEVPVLDLLDVFAIIADIFLQFGPSLTGKPRALDTQTIAARLMRSKNMAAELWGNEIWRLLTDQGIVLSSSDPSEQALLAHGYTQFWNNLVLQGFTPTLAQQVATAILSDTSSATEPLAHGLSQPAPQGFKLWGPPQVDADFTNQVNLYLQAGDTEAVAEQKAAQWIFTHENLNNLWYIQFSQTQPTQVIPFKNPPPLPPQPQPLPLPKGTPSPQPSPPPPPPPPPPSPPPPPPESDTSDDEVQDLNTSTSGYLYTIAQTLQQLTQPSGNPQSDECCQNVVIAINAVAAAVTAAAQPPASSGPAPAPADLSGIVAALDQLVTAGQTWLGLFPTNVAGLDGTLQSIATAIASTPGTDLSQVVAQLSKIFGTIDTPLAMFQQLADDGYFDPSYLTYFGQGATAPAGAYRELAGDWEWLRAKVKSWWGYDIGPPRTPTTPPPNPKAPAISGLTAYLNTTDAAILPILQPLIATVIGQLKPASAPAIGVYGVSPDQPVASAVSVALTASVAAWAMSYLGIDAGEPLAHIAELVAGAIGFEELRDVQIAPLVRNGLAKVADMQARAAFQQDLPGTSELQGLVARGILTSARSTQLIPFNGTPAELVPMLQAASYRGLNARQMLRLIETDLFTPSDIADELTFAGIRPASQNRMLTAAPFLATASQRSSLIAAYESAYVAGLYADADLLTAIADAQQNTDLGNLVLQRAKVQQLVAETKALEAEYSALYKGGLMDDATYRANLAAIGLQPAAVNMIAGKAEAAAQVTLQKQTTSAEKALERTTDAKARQTAMANFKSGNINAAGLAAALVATGLTVAQTAAWVDLAQLSFAGALRFVYGQQLTQPAATLLRQRVSAIEDQLKRQLITNATATSQLTALGIGPRYINAIIASSNALAAAGALATLTPVSTS